MIDWGWFFFLTQPMFDLLRFLYGFLGNFGLAMLTMTVIVKALFFPLANRSYASMAAMRRVQPEMKAMQERFKDDRAAPAAGDDGALQAREDQSALGLLADPHPDPGVLLALHRDLHQPRDAACAVLRLDPGSRGAGSDQHLHAVRALISVGRRRPCRSSAGSLHLGVWPLIMGCTMWVQMRLNPPPPDPAQQAIFNWMPVIFTFMLGTFPAGLVIYWSWNNFLSICQQYFIMSRHGAKVDLFGNILTSLGLKKKAAT